MFLLNYITHRRFKGKGISGEVNIPVFTELYQIKNYLVTDDQIICFVTSENAHNYFARNDDGNGIERGELTKKIKKKLNKNDDSYQQRWDLVCDDPICLKYKKQELNDYFLWNHDFYNAPIEDLQHIAKLIGLKEGI